MSNSQKEIAMLAGNGDGVNSRRDYKLPWYISAAIASPRRGHDWFIVPSTRQMRRGAAKIKRRAAK